jgi:DNA-directed RNA polymerase specialized sigma24 family protein
VLNRRLNSAAGRLRTLLTDRRDDPLTNQQLLQRFIASHEEAAFAALVDRHGAMVLAVCRSVLRHTQDAEDVCQATFLILARKAHAIRKPDSLAHWLHGVAYRLAMRARRAGLERITMGLRTGRHRAIRSVGFEEGLLLRQATERPSARPDGGTGREEKKEQGKGEVSMRRRESCNRAIVRIVKGETGAPHHSSLGLRLLAPTRLRAQGDREALQSASRLAGAPVPGVAQRTPGKPHRTVRHPNGKRSNKPMNF